MSNIIDDLKYTETHEWVKFKDDNKAIIGITDHAQHELTDIVFVELPEIGKEVVKGNIALVVESVKVAADIYSPLSGKVTAVNKELEKKPELINQDPYGNGWIFEIETNTKDEKLLNANEYRSLTE